MRDLISVVLLLRTSFVKALSQRASTSSTFIRDGVLRIYLD